MTEPSKLIWPPAQPHPLTPVDTATIDALFSDLHFLFAKYQLGPTQISELLAVYVAVHFMKNYHCTQFDQAFIDFHGTVVRAIAGAMSVVNQPGPLQ